MEHIDIGNYTLQEVKEYCRQDDMDCPQCIFHDRYDKTVCRFEGVIPACYDFSPVPNYECEIAESIENGNWIVRDECINEHTSDDCVRFYEEKPECQKCWEGQIMRTNYVNAKTHCIEPFVAKVPASAMPSIFKGQCIQREDFLDECAKSFD